LDAPQLTQDGETTCSSSRDVCRHGRINVQINAEVSNGADGRNVVGTDTERYGENLVHVSTRRTPHHFSLCGVQLQAVTSHPRRCHRYKQTRHSENLLNLLYHRSRTPVCRPRADGLEGCAGSQPAQASPCYTKCNSPPINGHCQCTNHRIAV